MIKKKSHVRKYSRKVKNKKVKCSRKLLRGGAVLAPESYQLYKPPQKNHPYHPYHPYQSLRQPLKFTITTPFEKKIMELYEFSKLEADKDYISQIFKKFKYSYAQTNPAYKETDSILYLKKDEVDKEINPTEVFKVYGLGNQSISIEYNDDKKFKDIGKFYEITPLELSVDTMQLAVNTGKIEISTDKDGNSYLGFVDFPSLVITEKPSGTGFSYSSRKNATWISVYEQEFEEKDKVFDLIETMDGRHIEQSTFDSEIKSIDVKISKLDKTIYKDSVKIRKLEELKPKKKGNVTMTNEALFIKKQDEMRILLSDIEISSDEKAKLKLKIEEQVKYRAYVNIEEDGDGSNKNVITEDISWAMKNSLWLEEYLKLNTKYMTSKTKEDSLKANELLEKIGEAYECDLSGLDEQYLIIEEFENKVKNEGDDEIYVIVGYPERQMKEHILNFWQVNTKLNNNLTEHIANLYDKFQTNEIDKIDYKKTKERKLYNLYSKYRNSLDYLLNSLKEIEFKNDKQKYELFKTEFLNNYNLYYQQIAFKYLKKPMNFIKYVFFVFKKEINSKLIPMVFNIKELKKNHQAILKHVDKLIKKELSYRFEILDDDEYNNKSLLFDDEYKLWYSGFTSGNMFHIDSEYVHIMSNISRKAHHYLNFKTLEEIIYSCRLQSNEGADFLQDIKITYQVREHKINNYRNQLQNNNTKKIEPNRTKKVFALYEEDKLFKQFYKEKILKEEKYNQENFNLWKTQIVMTQFTEWKIKKEKEEKEEKYKKEKLKKKLVKEDMPNIIFILMFKSSIQEYTFIYLLNDKYYKLVMKSNMSSIIEQIIMKLQIIYEHKNSITFNEDNKLFSITNNEELDITFYSNIFKYNPLVYYRNTAFFNGPIKQNPNNYFENSMIKDTTQISNYGYSLKPTDLTNSTLKTKNKLNTLVLINIYNQIPILAQNFLLNDYYIKMVKLYEEKEIEKQYVECNTLIKYNEKFSPCDKKMNCIPQETINCVHINLGKCGYNFVEIIDNATNKIVVYIVPYGMKINKEYNTNNFEAYKDTEESKVVNPFLGNNRDLDDRSINMLNQLQKLYVNNQKILCFVHPTSNLKYMCLHFHIIPEDEYKRIFPKEEIGTYMSQSININTLINNIGSNSNYYKYSNFSLIRQQ